MRRLIGSSSGKGPPKSVLRGGLIADELSWGWRCRTLVRPGVGQEIARFEYTQERHSFIRTKPDKCEVQTHTQGDLKFSGDSAARLVK
jgi:hypothetical protein